MVTQAFDKSVQNEAVLADVVAAMREADYARVARLIAHDVTWTVPGSGPVAGTYRSRDELLGVIGALSQLSEGSFSWDVRAVEGDEYGGTMTVRTRAARNGRCIQYDNVITVRIEDGQVVEGIDRVDDQEFVDEFWS